MLPVFSLVPRHRPNAACQYAAGVALAIVLSASGAMAQRPADPTAAASSAQDASSPQAGWENGFFIQSADGSSRIQFGAVVQLDGRFSLDERTPVVDTFTIRKLRPVLQGRVARYFDFRLVPDFGNGTAVLFDGYLDMRISRAFRIRAGKDKTPFGLEVLQSDPALLFPERSLASSLAPNRDVGVQVLGELFEQRLIYAAGVFNGVPDGANSTTDVDTNTGKDLAGRVVVQPFVATSGPARGLGLHLGGTIGDQTGTLPSFRTSAGQVYFSYAGAIAQGERLRLTPSVFYYNGPIGLFAEYVRSNQDVAHGGQIRAMTNTAWDVTGTWILSREVASSGIIQPSRPFDPPTRRWGALQIVARYAELHVDAEAFRFGLAAANTSRVARQTSVGANWYPIGAVKYYLTYERTAFEGPVPRPTEHVAIFRAQLAF
jgi:phosphate-selective porin OprO/OprP